MLYCDSCAEERHYPLSKKSKAGKCEICGVEDDSLNEWPTEDLPK